MKLSMKPKNANVIEAEYLKAHEFDGTIPAGQYRRRKKSELSIEEQE